MFAVRIAEDVGFAVESVLIIFVCELITALVPLIFAARCTVHFIREPSMDFRHRTSSAGRGLLRPKSLKCHDGRGQLEEEEDRERSMHFFGVRHNLLNPRYRAVKSMHLRRPSRIGVCGVPLWEPPPVIDRCDRVYDTPTKRGAKRERAKRHMGPKMYLRIAPRFYYVCT